MRPIKFRAWEKENKEIVPWEQISFGHCPQHDDHIHISDVFNDIQEEIILMQFTGLRDKAGVEIYEGDILTDNINSHLFEIRWNDVEGGFVCYFPDMAGSWELKRHFRDIQTMKIVGNIHENPELLK